jgi:hypothetical protein
VRASIFTAIFSVFSVVAPPVFAENGEFPAPKFEADTLMEPTVIETVSLNQEIGGFTETTTITQTRGATGDFQTAQLELAVVHTPAPNVSDVNRTIQQTDPVTGQLDTVGRVQSRRVETETLIEFQETAEARQLDGSFLVSRQVTSVTRKNPDGSLSTTRTEEVRDPSGLLIPQTEVEENVRSFWGDLKEVDRFVKRRDPTTGGFIVHTMESERTLPPMADGSTLHVREIKTPSTFGWVVTERVTRRERVLADGSLVREILIEKAQPKSADDISRGERGEPELRPHRTIYERVMTRFDGSKTIERTPLVHDPSGRWVPETYSPELADLWRQP